MQIYPLSGILWLLALAIALPAIALENDPSEELALLSKWIETKKENAALRSRWLVEKQDLMQEEAILDAEVKSLKLQLEALRNLNTSLLQDSANADAASAHLDEQIQSLESKLANYKAELHSRLKYLPPPLQDSVKSLLLESPEKNNGLGARYQRLITAIATVHSFANETHYEVEIHTSPSGTKRQMDTLYWGLSLAYSCDASGSVALIGQPSPNGWQWSDLSQHSSEVRTLLDVQKGILPPAYIVTPTSAK